MAMKSLNDAIISISMDDKEQVGNVPTPQTNTSADVPADASQVSEPKNTSAPTTEQSDVSKDMEALLDEAASLSNAEPSEEEVAAVAPTPRKKINLRAFGYAFLGVLVLGLLAGLLYIGAQILSNKTVADTNIYDSDIIFIREQENSGNYALFDLKTGEKMTEFEFSEAGTFVNGYAYAKSDAGYMIYRADGKLSVPAGKYDEIEQFGGAFLVKLSGSSSYSVIDGSNRSLAEYAEEPAYRGASISNGRFYIYRDKKSHYHLANAYGNELASFVCDEEPISKETGDKADYVACGGKYYMLNNDDLTVASSFELPENVVMKNFSDDHKLAVAVSEDDEPKWYVISDGAVHGFGDMRTCMLRNNYSRSYVACTSKEDEYGQYRLFQKDGAFMDKAVNILPAFSTLNDYEDREENSYAIIDGGTYAYIDEKSDAHFFVDGEEAKKVSLSAKSQILTISGAERYYVGLEYGESAFESIKVFDENGEFIVDLEQHCGNASTIRTLKGGYIFCQGMSKEWEDADDYASLLKSLKSVLLDKNHEVLITGKDAFALVDGGKKLISADGTWAALLDDEETAEATYVLHDLTGKTLAMIEGNCTVEASEGKNDSIYDTNLYFMCKKGDQNQVRIMNVEDGTTSEFEGKLGDIHNEKYFTIESENSLDYYLIDGTKLYSQPKEA